MIPSSEVLNSSKEFHIFEQFLAWVALSDHIQTYSDYTIKSAWFND